ncbi:hypothetical protein AB6A40_002632 [Gnathostoma spinigerum]|uniref:Uncharacterized protein n=1 Tax=Gnathostoma spinigerum TaxID=75299 RepID=A0ABD6E743_9BILA
MDELMENDDFTSERIEIPRRAEPVDLTHITIPTNDQSAIKLVDDNVLGKSPTDEKWDKGMQCFIQGKLLSKTDENNELDESRGNNNDKVGLRYFKTKGEL